MFTGIVIGLGRIVSWERQRGGAQLVVALPARGQIRAGESVCVSGVCLTAIRTEGNLVADVSRETLRLSTLQGLRPGDAVNLERALAWGDRLSGHFVLGHVDGVCRLVSIAESGNSWIYRFSIPRGLGRYIVRKGSVALDGISLTVAARRAREFDVAVVPETRRRTTLGLAAPGRRFNFEADVFARYGVGRWRKRIRVPRFPEISK